MVVAMVVVERCEHLYLPHQQLSGPDPWQLEIQNEEERQKAAEQGAGSSERAPALGPVKTKSRVDIAYHAQGGSLSKNATTSLVPSKPMLQISRDVPHSLQCQADVAIASCRAASV